MAIQNLPVVLRVPVRDYLLGGKRLLVQSSNLDLQSATPNIIVRHVEGNIKNETRIVKSAEELTPDGKGKVYHAEAHGILVSATSKASHSPVWVPGNINKASKKDETYVVDLATFEASKVPIAQVCWVPSRQGPDGTLYTILGSTLRLAMEKSKHEERIPVIV
ncbi:Uu.00g119190.m01.CDS01 [Anthostomella pinea]|uniref:Uu.00g119190.m01.CDS01 n=1 Tax=Anthostomella pinea TaxID=933095 RepID=A0AAI8VHI7_9PEZI|nr:Uu.00g119190.m01.CDS01 [Anthostomella pinea]